MATYYSDSEDDIGSQSYTETSTLLGYVSTSPSNDDISYIGGQPQWLDPSSPPSAALARCKVCRDIMVSLLQLNGELPDFPGHERRLYVLACRRKTCRRKEGSLRAIRANRVDPKVAERERAREEKRAEEKKANAASTGVVKSAGLGESLFGAKPATAGGAANPFAPANPFSSGAGPVAGSNPFSKLGAFPPLNSTAPAQETSKSTLEAQDLPQTFANTLSLNNPQKPKTFGPAPPPEPWPEANTFPAAYPQLFFDSVENEQLDAVEEEDISAKIPTTMEIDDEAGGSSSGGKEDKDAYESTIDNTFQRFADRVGQNPEQVIRYEFKGQPLLYTKNDAVGKLLSPPHNSNAKVQTQSRSASRMKACENCGAARVFEVQLCPFMITELERDEMALDEGMEWGTVIVGVCERDCSPGGVRPGEVGYAEEWCGVQWEDVEDRRR